MVLTETLCKNDGVTYHITIRLYRIIEKNNLMNLSVVCVSPFHLKDRMSLCFRHCNFLSSHVKCVSKMLPDALRCIVFTTLLTKFIFKPLQKYIIFLFILNVKGTCLHIFYIIFECFQFMFSKIVHIAVDTSPNV